MAKSSPGQPGQPLPTASSAHGVGRELREHCVCGGQERRGITVTAINNLKNKTLLLL